MQLNHSDEPLAIEGVSLFLGGPTPRRRDVVSWRVEAIEILATVGFAGTVLVPERRDWEQRFDYLDQVEWEFAGLERADAIVFWIPRDVELLPGFTTNVEFGRYIGSGRVVYGRPDGRPHNRYLDWLYTKLTGQAPHNELVDTLRVAVQLAQVNDGSRAERKRGTMDSTNPDS